MKPKLSHKIPLQPNLSASQAIAYMEHYRYLEQYNFGPYYLDSLALKDVRVVYFEHIDAAFRIKNRPLLEAYVNRWYPDRNFFPTNASHFIWVTYERICDNGNGNVTFITCEGSLHELLEKHNRVIKCEHILSIEDATKLARHFSYLVNNCIVLPGNYIFTGLQIVNLSEFADTTPDTVTRFVNDRYNKKLIKQDSFAVIAAMSRNAGENVYSETEQWFLCDLLNQRKIKMISKKSDCYTAI